MPLDPLGVLAGVNPFLSNAFNQVVSLLTGVMTDQPVTLADGLTVKGGLTASGGSSMVGPVAISSNLFVAGAITSSQTLTGSSNLAISGTGTFSSNVTVAGVIDPAALTKFSGDATQTGTDGYVYQVLGSAAFHDQHVAPGGQINYRVGQSSTESGQARTFMTVDAATATVRLKSSQTSSQNTALNLGSSGPSIQFGSSIPTSACIPGSLFLNAGGSSTTSLLVCIPNSGGASSSNWDTFSLI